MYTNPHQIRTKNYIKAKNEKDNTKKYHRTQKNSKAAFLKIKNELPHLVKEQKGRRKRKYLICSILIDKMTDISRSFSIFDSRVLQRNLERIFSVNQTKAKSATMPCHLPQEKEKKKKNSVYLQSLKIGLSI